MNEKKSFADRFEAFIGGKGFYIVLSVCLVVIGISAYVLIAGSGFYVADRGRTDILARPEEQTVVAPPPVETAESAEEPAQLPFEEETQTGEVGNWTEGQAETAASAQFVWPVEGIITQDYCVTSLVYSEKFGDWRTHAAVDVAAPAGTQVMAASAGVVESVESTSLGGTTVVIEHAGGLKSTYANLQELPTVIAGDNVMTGEIIGAVGATAPGETKENPHLLFSMALDGQSVDPCDYLPPR